MLRQAQHERFLIMCFDRLSARFSSTRFSVTTNSDLVARFVTFGRRSHDPSRREAIPDEPHIDTRRA